jgi:hypothetical protein
VLVNAKRYDLIAELIDLLLQDEEERRRLVAGQRRRLDDLAPSRVADRLKRHITDLDEKANSC